MSLKIDKKKFENWNESKKFDKFIRIRFFSNKFNNAKYRDILRKSKRYFEIIEKYQTIFDFEQEINRIKILHYLFLKDTKKLDMNFEEYMKKIHS